MVRNESSNASRNPSSTLPIVNTSIVGSFCFLGPEAVTLTSLVCPLLLDVHPQREADTQKIINTLANVIIECFNIQSTKNSNYSKPNNETNGKTNHQYMIVVYTIPFLSRKAMNLPYAFCL